VSRLVAVAALSAAMILAAPSAAHADETPLWLVSLPLLAVDRGTLAVQGERYLDDRFVVTASLAGRRADAGDFDARGFALGGGARWFFAPFARWGRGGGGFVAGRVDLTWRWLLDEADGHSLGDSKELASSLYVGWRLIAWRHFELTPELGLSVAREWTTAALASRVNVKPAFGLTVGYAW
jgi:hypothetical protein